MLGLTHRSPETLLREGCRLLGVDHAKLSTARRNLYLDGIADAQAAFLALKGDDNVITHIREVAAPRNLHRSKNNGLSVGYLNAHSSLSIMLGLTLSLLDETTFGMLGLDDRPKNRKHK